jgi:peptide deformylase
MIFPITQLGNPVLRAKARPVKKMRRAELERLIRDMIRTMRKARGVGIAAPQVGKSLRLFIVAPRPSVRYPKAPRLAPIAMINPRLIAASKSRNTGWEGCLSIPGIRGKVPRYSQVKIRFQTPSGDQKQAILTGFVARIFQHEFDHINGKVFLDRVEDTRTLATEREYRSLFRPGRQKGTI